MKCTECNNKIEWKMKIIYWFHWYFKRLCRPCLIENVQRIQDEFIFMGDASQID